MYFQRAINNDLEHVKHHIYSYNQYKFKFFWPYMSLSQYYLKCVLSISKIQANILYRIKNFLNCPKYIIRIIKKHCFIRMGKNDIKSFTQDIIHPNYSNFEEK